MERNNHIKRGKQWEFGFHAELSPPPTSTTKASWTTPSRFSASPSRLLPLFSHLTRPPSRKGSCGQQGIDNSVSNFLNFAGNPRLGTTLNRVLLCVLSGLFLLVLLEFPCGIVFPSEGYREFDRNFWGFWFLGAGTVSSLWELGIVPQECIS